MALGSFVHDALADLDSDALARMLDLDETLFVEHKKSTADESAYELVRAVSAFANTLGGWVLLGVHDGKPLEEPASWALSDAPPLVDFVRDRLRDEVDPLPPFEAKVMEHEGGRIGVVRVYESSDTPHVGIRSGAVFVREVAGVRDAANPGSPGPGQRGERVYKATQIRNRAQLIELAARGRAAAERAAGLVDPGRPLPLVSSHLPFELERVGGGVFQPIPSQRPAVVARMVPFTLAPRFQGWATTANCSSALLSGVEELSRRAGLASSWVEPDPSGAGVAVPLDEGALHTDGAGLPLAATAHLVLDAAGVAGAALSLSPPDDGRRRSWLRLDQLVDLVRPPMLVATSLLEAGEFLGRTRCQIDLVGLSRVFLLENAGDDAGRLWMPTSGELSLPADAAQIEDLARRAANAFWRSAGVAVWDSQAH
jgi:Putative DNA-binding domain